MAFSTSKFKACSVILILLLLSCISVDGRSYKVVVRGDAGGVVSASGESMSGIMEITGSSLGEGTFHRFTDLNLNEVRMIERISTKQGVLSTNEEVVVQADAINDSSSLVVKYPESQTFKVGVKEKWPVMLEADRSIDYAGRGINDREAFGNNWDCVGTTYLYTTDLLKERTCRLTLENRFFLGYVTDDSSEVDRLPPNMLQANKSTDYQIESVSNGIATLRYRQVDEDYSILSEGMESYSGSFHIGRRISMSSPGNESLDEDEEEKDWLECCFGDLNNSTSSLELGFVLEGYEI